MTNNEKEEQPVEPEIIKLDLDKVRNLIPQYSSEKLCEMIICDRYFGFNQEMTVMCMQELAARRGKGDDFQFEQYIEDNFKKLPVLSFGVPDLRSTLNQMIKAGKKQ